MKNLFLILITLIFFACTEDNVPSCEENNTYDLEVINNNDTTILFVIWTWYDEVIESHYYTNDTIVPNSKIDFLKIIWMGEGEITVIEDLPVGYSVYGYSYGSVDSNIWNFYDNFSTESCESYTIEVIL